MSNQYSVKYSQRFDEIVYQVYGNLDLFEELLSINTHLLDKMYLDTGDIINLIEVQPKTQTIQKEENLQSIW